MPPTKRQRTARSDKRLASNRRLIHIQSEVSKLKRDRATVNRAEFAEMTASLRQLHKNTDDLVEHTKNLATQFTRIAQIQAELDLIKHALGKAKLVK